ncbi:hypothetical protein ACWIWK_05175 [Helicobacter sp. 23-1048]
MPALAYLAHICAFYFAYLRFCRIDICKILAFTGEILLPVCDIICRYDILLKYFFV